MSKQILVTAVKNHLVEEVEKSVPFIPSTRLATEIVDIVMGTIVLNLAREGRTLVPKLGVLKVHSREARSGLNPRTGEPIAIQAKSTARLTASQALREYLTENAKAVVKKQKAAARKAVARSAVSKARAAPATSKAGSGAPKPAQKLAPKQKSRGKS